MGSGILGFGPNDAAGFHGALAAGSESQAVGKRGVLAGTVGLAVTGDNNVVNQIGPELLSEFVSFIRQQAAETSRPQVTDIFRVLRKAEDAPKAFFDSLSPNARLIPYDNSSVPYLPASRGETSTTDWLKGKLGRLLVLVGRRGAGKSREVAELARELCLRDWTVCLAQLSRRHKMGPADALLPDDNLLFVVDDLHKHTVRESEQQRDYWDRLYAFLKPHFDTPGLKVRVLLTTLPEADGSHLPPRDHPLAKGMTVCELPDFEVAALQSLLRQVAGNAGIDLPQEVVASLAQQGDRTPKTIVANVERALRRAIPLSTDTWTHTWEGRWTDDFKEARLQQPHVADVFRALYLLRRAGIPERASYVIGLAARLTQNDARPAVDLLVESGLLALREGRLIVFSEEQLTSCLESLGEPLPDLRAQWDGVIASVAEGAGREPDWLPDMTALAEMLVDAELWERAESVATTILDRDPLHAKPFVWRSIARFHLVKLADAEQDVTRVLEIEPEDKKAALFRGAIRVLRGNYAEAEGDLTAAVDSGDRKALYARATTRMLLNKPAEAESDFTELLREEPRNIAALRLRGYLRFGSRDFAGAVSDYSAVLETEPKDKLSLLMRGLSYMNTAEFQPMATDFGALIELQPSALYHGLRGMARSRLGDVDQALGDLTEALNGWRQDPLSRVLPKLAQIAKELNSGERVVSDELYRDMAVEFASVFGVEGADADLLAKTDFFRDWLNRQWASRIDPESAATLSLWTQPGAVYQAARGDLYFQKGLYAEAEADYRAAMEQGLDKAIAFEWLGRSRQKQGDLAGAEAFYSELVTLVPQSATAYFLRGWVRVDRMANENALSDLKTAQERGYVSAAVFGLQGVCLFRLGRLDEAKAVLTEAVGLDDRYPMGQYLLGAILLKQGEFSEGVSHYDRAVDCGFAAPAVFLERGYGHVSLGNLEAAEADAARARDAGADEMALAPLLAQLEIAREQYAAAEERCSEAIAAGPSDLSLFLFRAKARFLLERHPEAEEDYTLAIEGGLADAAVFAERGWSRLQQNDLEAALEDLDRAVGLQPQNSVWRRWRAFARRRQGDTPGVMEDLVVVFDQGEPIALDYQMRGAARLRLEDEEGALSDFDKSFEMGNDAAELHLYRSLARFNLRDYSGAAEDCGSVIGQNPEVALAYQMRALALIYQGKVDEALTDCDRASELEPEDGMTHQCRGFYQVATGNSAAAIESFQAELVASPGPEAHFRLGLACYLAGQAEESLSHYSAGLSEATDGFKRRALADLEHWLEPQGAGRDDARLGEIRRMLSGEAAGAGGATAGAAAGN